MAYNPALVGFVANANHGRGTISLLLQCLSSIFLSVYTVLHFNIPVRPLSKWAIFVRKMIFVTIIVIAPELLPFNAFNDWYRARMLQKEIKTSVGIDLSVKQAHYLLSGGVQISASTKDHNKALEIELLVFINQVALAPSDGGKMHQKFHPFWDTVIAKIPSDRELDDKSKSDTVGKGITCVQAGKSLALIIGRLVYGLEISLLEVTTAAYIILALISYTFWFKKPYNIATYQTVELPFCSDELVFDREKYNLSRLSSEPTEHLKRRGAREINPNNLASANLYTGSMSQTDFYSIPDKNAIRRNDIISLISLICFCSLLAGIHISAWNYHYPSQTEAWIWRASCLLIGLLPSCLIHAQYVEHWVKNSSRGTMVWWHQKISSVSLYTLYAMYPVARIFLIIEIFISLRRAPAEIYQQPDWSTYLGHIGAWSLHCSSYRAFG